MKKVPIKSKEWEALWMPWHAEAEIGHGYKILTKTPRYLIAEDVHSLVADMVVKSHNEYIKRHKSPKTWFIDRDGVMKDN